MIVNIILGVIVPLILLVVGGYLMLTFRDERILKWVNIAVKAAEQIYNSPGQGRAKFDYVANWISEKFGIPEEDLKNLIEGAVYELNAHQTNPNEEEDARL